MSKNILIIQGHPDRDEQHLCHALASAYAEGAARGGHAVQTIDVAALDFPVLRSQREFHGPLPDSLEPCRVALNAADHLLIVYPLWLGTMPALLKAFIEQLFRPGVALQESDGGWPKPLLTDKSCRVVVTMGMPALAYRWFYASHSLRSLERNILRFCGIRPVRDTVIGRVDSADARTRESWMTDMRSLGSRAV